MIRWLMTKVFRVPPIRMYSYEYYPEKTLVRVTYAIKWWAIAKDVSDFRPIAVEMVKDRLKEKGIDLEVDPTPLEVVDL